MKNVSLVRKKDDDLGDNFFYICDFCGKSFYASNSQMRLHSRLSEGTHCHFCLRHGFNHQGSRDVLPLSFRGLAGFIYYRYYRKEKTIWFSELEDMVKEHERIGLLNPLFSYDPESMIWFVDFSRVGRGKRKLKVIEIKKTILNCLACFNPVENMIGGKPGAYTNKFMKAIDLFHSKRVRPEGKRRLIPTVRDCVTQKFPLEATRNFCILKPKRH